MGKKSLSQRNKLHHHGKTMKLPIINFTEEASNMKLLTLGRGRDSFTFHPGQSLVITIHAPEKNILNQKRYYSIVSSPLQKSYLEILLKDNPTSLVGHYLYEHLEVGDELEAEGPFGKMILPEHAPRLTLIAGGSGIAPFISMIRTIQLPITLFYSTKKQDEIAFAKELEELHTSKKINYIHTLTQEQWNGTTGRIDKQFLEKNLLHKEGLFFICGPPQMVKDISVALQELGIKEESILYEEY